MSEDITTSGRVGTLTLRVGSYWAFKDAQKPHENDDLAMLRIVRERNFYHKWANILAGAFLIALLAAALVGA